MIKTAVLVAASLFAAPLLAQEQVYIYVSYKDANGASFRHKLDCVDSECKVNVKEEERSISLSAAQHKELLDALQAESKQFLVAADPSLIGNLMKVKLRYDTPRKRLQIERRMPGDKPADVTSELRQVIKTHLDLDLSKPVLPKTSATPENEPSAEPGQRGQSQ